MFDNPLEEFLCELSLEGLDPFNVGGEIFEGDYSMKKLTDTQWKVQATYDDRDSFLMFPDNAFLEAIQRVEKRLGRQISKETA
jgi:hypothetical protein